MSCGSIRGPNGPLVMGPNGVCVDPPSKGGKTNFAITSSFGPGGLVNPKSAPDVAQFGLGDIARGIGGLAKRIIPGGIDDAIIDLATGAHRRNQQRMFGGQTFGSGFAGPCGPGMVRGPFGDCQVASPVIPGSPGITTPAERSIGGNVAQSGMIAPSIVQRLVHQCPTFANGKTGILWMHPLSGTIVCLPRGVSGRGWGLVRKNKPKPKPPMTAAEAKQFKKFASLQGKAKKLATLAGLTTRKR